jgi:transposase
LCQKTGRCELFRLEWQNGPTIIEALTRLVETHKGKKIVIVWDNAAWHKTKDLRQLLGAGGSLQNVHLIAMPPYAPDHNPIEHVWKDTKEHISNIQRDTFDETRRMFEQHIVSRRFDYKI